MSRLGAVGKVARRSPPAPRPGSPASRTRPSASLRRGCAAVPTVMPPARSERRSYVDHRLDAFDGGSIYVVEAGAGPPIVFAHGVTQLESHAGFTSSRSFPRAGFRTIAYDHRGHGQSVLGTAGHSLENLALDLRTVLEELDLRGAVLVGHSMGGVAVQAFVTRFPEIAAERVAGIVLLSTLAKTPLGSHSTRTKARIEKITKRAPDMSWVWAIAEPRLLLAARSGSGAIRSRVTSSWCAQMLSECPPETRLDAPRALIGLDLTERASRACGCRRS